jgi:hypothetical protein
MFVGAALEQRDSYSIATQNVRSVASTTCGLADSIALELTPLYGALVPVVGAAGRDAPGVFAVNGGFAAGHVPPYGFGGGDPAFDVPVWGSLVGEDADRATGTARSGWYEITGRLRDGSAPLVIAVAGRTHGGNASPSSSDDVAATPSIPGAGSRSRSSPTATTATSIR